MKVLNCNESVGCPDKQGEDKFLLNVQNSINEKPKLRSLSLKKRRAEKTNEQNEPNLKRTCIEPKAAKREFIAPGLKNLGNTCYINSVLQVLFHLPKFRASISSLTQDIINLNLGMSKESFFNYSKFDLVRHLNKLFYDMQNCQSDGPTVVDPSGVYSILELLKPSFRFGEEHDAHEFLMFLLSLIQDATKEVSTLLSRTNKISEGDFQSVTSELPTGKTSSPPAVFTDPDQSHEVIPTTTSTRSPKNHSLQPQINFYSSSSNKEHRKVRDSRTTTDFISDTFHGTMERVTRCLECETESKTPEPFQDLLLHMKRVKELPQEQGPHFGSIGNFPDEDKDLSDDEDEDSEAPTVFMALRDVEKLGSANKFHCLICRHKVEAQRRISFLRCPPVLIIHIQRLPQLTSFTSCGMTMSTKVTENMKIPLELNCLEENCLSPLEHRMKLFAVVSHTGYTTSSGHYRAYINSSIKDIHNLPASLNPEPSDISISANPNLEYISPPSLSNQHNLSRNEQPLPWIELDDHQAKRLLSEDLERITGTGYSFNTPNMLFYSRTF